MADLSQLPAADEQSGVAFDMLTEPVVIPDTFVTGMAEPECVNDEGVLRLTFYTKQRSAYGGAGASEYVIVSKLVVSPQGAWTIAKAVLAYFGYVTLGLARQKAMRLVS